MPGVIYLAWRYLAFYRWRTAWLVGCICLTLFLPLSSRLLMTRFQTELKERAVSTPLVIGAKGSELELAIHTLHFSGNAPDTIQFEMCKTLRDEDLGTIIPIHARFQTRAYRSRQDGYAIVGTTLDYFEFRDLRLDRGHRFGTLGECVIGSTVAREQDLSIGDTIMSQTNNAHNLIASQPLKMRIVGILKPSMTDDDLAVFVDVKTAWVIEGLGHGHPDLENDVDEGMLLSRDDEEIVASQAVTGYLEITPENAASFHFHGDMNEFPVTALIAAPKDSKHGLILEGMFVGPGQTAQVIRPDTVIEELFQRVFRVRRFFDFAMAAVFVVTTLFVVLVTMLSRQLRRREMATLFKIGCGPYTIVCMQALELFFIFVISLILAGLLATVTSTLAPTLIRQLIF